MLTWGIESARVRDCFCALRCLPSADSSRFLLLLLKLLLPRLLMMVVARDPNVVASSAIATLRLRLVND
jgi:hypothetical protein